MSQRHGEWGFWGQTTWRDYASGNEKDLHTVELTSKWYEGTNANVGSRDLSRHLSDFWSGLTDFPLQPAVTNSTVTSIGNLAANAAEKAGSMRGMVTGKALGVVGILMTMNNDIENHGHLTAGDWTKAAIGVGLMLSPVGWFTLGYAAIDITIGIVTVTSVTDRIGAGIDNTIKNW